jgi:hypothetical protein
VQPMPDIHGSSPRISSCGPQRVSRTPTGSVTPEAEPEPTLRVSCTRRTSRPSPKTAASLRFYLARLSISQRRLTNVAPQADQAPLSEAVSAAAAEGVCSPVPSAMPLGLGDDQIQRSRLRPRPGRIAAHQDREATFTRVAGVPGFQLRRHRRPTTPSYPARKASLFASVAHCVEALARLQPSHEYANLEPNRRLG